MTTRIHPGRVLTPDGIWLTDAAVTIEDGVIRSVGEASAAADETIDLSGLSLLPGLVDIHTHGRIGHDFADATVEEMRAMREDYARHGVTTVFPTLASATAEEWHTAIGRVQECGFDGIHLEGRYLNPKKRGAHAPGLLVPLDARELATFLGEIRIPCRVTAAYELDGDGSFSAEAVRRGAKLSLGHTDATAEETRRAIGRGVTCFTHLFNAMPPIHHREGGAVCVALTDDSVYTELIVDGLHICPDAVRLVWKAKGAERLVLITDSMSGTGCPDGKYSIAGEAVVVRNGRAETLDGALAGSTLNLWDGVRNLMRFADVPLAQAALCATRNPARAAGIDAAVGTIERGRRADLIAVDGNAEICAVWRNGQRI